MRQVISASRRTDLAMRYTGWLSKMLTQGWALVPQPYGGEPRLVDLSPQKVHTLALWSKDFGPLLRDDKGLREALAPYDQVFCHLTITGLGRTRLEPNVSPWEEVARQIGPLMELVGHPGRLAVRFDPLIHWYEGEEIASNRAYARPILEAAAKAGVKQIITSFATLYGKVWRRGFRWYDPPPAERLETAAELARLAKQLDLSLHSCADHSFQEVGISPAKCIDGELLSKLHPKGYPAAAEKDPGQRRECGCTTSIDIGAYTMRCPNACRYCYANPLI